METQQQEERNILQKILKPETPRGRLRQFLFLIAVLVLGGLFVVGGGYYNQGVDWLAERTGDSIVLPKTQTIPFSLGLDLQGGTHLVYKADMSDIPPEQEEAAIRGVRDVIERRVDVFGVSEPSIRTVQTEDGNYRISADLAGIKDVSEAIEQIGRTPLLQFKEMVDEAAEPTTEEEEEIEEFNIQAEERAQELLARALSEEEGFEDLIQDHDESESIEPRWVSATTESELAAAMQDLSVGEIYSELVETSQGFHIVKLLDQRAQINEFTGEEAREVKASHLLLCHQETPDCDNELSREQAYEKIKEIGEEASPENFSSLVEEYSTEPGAAQREGSLGWFGRGEMVEPFEEAAFEQEVGTISYVVETQFGFHLIHKVDERQSWEYQIQDILIQTRGLDPAVAAEPEWRVTELSGKHLDSASVQWSQTGQPQVGLRFDSEGADLFAKITEENIGNVVGIFLDGEVVSAPNVNERISGGEAVITGDFSVDEAQNMVRSLNEGALPVPIELISQRTIGPSLGQESIDNSLSAGIMGLILVAVFMILIYRGPGLVSVLSLLVYGILVLAVFKLLSITLTLAGLAGFILSIGMAVDANVLIWERLKEELRSGKESGEALSEAFRRAWLSIRDGNFSTLITCFILMEFTTSLVRGFAITLGIGVLVSLFAAMVVTKTFIMLAPGSWLNKKIIGLK